MKPPGLRRATLLAAALLGVGLAASPASAEQSGKTQRIGFSAFLSL